MNYKLAFCFLTILFSINQLFSQNKPKKIVKYVKNSKIRYEYYMQNAKPNGSYTYYYNNQKQVEGNLKNDYPDGEWKYYDTRGKIRIKGNYEQGEKVGPWYYYINDTLKSKLLFDPERKVDTLYGYRPDGSISHIQIVNKLEDRTNSVLYSKSGNEVQKYTLLSGRLHGNYERFNEKGEKTFELIYNNGKPMDMVINKKNDLFSDYQSGFLSNGNGVLTVDLLDTLNGNYFRFQELMYYNGDLNGAYKLYYPSGKPACVGQYKDGFLFGDFIYYNKTGIPDTVNFNLADSLTYDYSHNVMAEYFLEFSNYGDKPLFFDGYLNKFRSYVENTLKYPLISAENGEEGRVLIRFSVNIEGKIVKPEILEGVSPYIDAEALRVIGLSPFWQPGFRDDLPMEVRFTFPINFVLR